MRRLLSSVAVLGALLATTACGAPSVFPETPPPVVDYSNSPAPETVREHGPAPVKVRVPQLGVESTLDDLHLDDDRRLQVPPVDEPMQAGWFADGVLPGDPGPAVIAAHVNGRGPNGKSIPGLFANLHTLKPGARVEVDRADGSTVAFRVTRVETHPKDTFPTRAVYGDTPGPELRLITCGDAFDPATRHYTGNVIAWAVQA